MAAMRVGAAPEGRLPEPVLDRARKASLAAALGVEATSAWAASFAVSPLVFIVDKAIVSNASGRQRLFTCVKNELVGLITAPHLLLGNPGFRWIWTVYLGTYTAANVTRAVCERFDFNWQLPTFLASSAANVTLSILKDRTFARMYSARGAPPPLRVPLITYSLFTARDLATVACSFNVPHLVADWIRSSDSDGIPEIVKRNPATAAQLLVPTTLQFLSTPVHLLALDFYNRQGTPTEKVPLASRARFVAREYPVSTFARMMRILPAFGIGGILNRELRLAGNAWLEER